MCDLARLQSSTFDDIFGQPNPVPGQAGGGKKRGETLYTYSTVLQQLAGLEGANVLEDAYSAIGEQLSRVEAYVHSWLQYQALWDIDVITYSPLFIWQCLSSSLTRFRRSLR